MAFQDVVIERDVPCQMRDGITLYSNIYRPREEGVFPVLLTRLPYDKNLPNFSHRYIDPIRAALSGYVVIIQDVRGRYTSEGDFQPFIQEANDGYDTVEWAATLSYSNGKVGMFGMSYYGFTQLYAALERPPSLVALAPAMTGHITSDGLFNRDGIHEVAAVETWMLESIAPNYLAKHAKEHAQDSVDEVMRDLNEIDEWHRYKPVKEWLPLKKHPLLLPFFRKFFLNNAGNQLRDEALDRKKELERIDIPAYHIAGWYDSHLAPTLMNYESMQDERKKQKLIIGPWAHGVFDSDIGERSFGIESSGDYIEGENDLTSLHIQWFNHWLKEENNKISEEAPVKIFTMGTNQWRTENEWPLHRTEYTSFYLTSNGNAKADNEAGTLTRELPEEDKKDIYIHDPENPVPTHGGGTLFYKGRNVGPRDQRIVEERDDVLIYTSEPLKEAIEVTGWVTVKLWASSDAVDTDFTAKLIDVLPDGRAYNLTDGIVRAKQQHPVEVPIKGKILEYEIDLWATSNVFLPGHSIRLEIASSNFPRYEVNLGTGETMIDAAESVEATQVIYHGANYPSQLVLPIIPQTEAE